MTTIAQNVTTLLARALGARDPRPAAPVTPASIARDERRRPQAPVTPASLAADELRLSPRARFQPIDTGLPGGGDAKSTRVLDKPLFTAGPAYKQVEQGWIPDCEIPSAAIAIARQNPNFFQGRISQDAKGMVTVKTDKWTQTVDKQVYWDAENGLTKFGGDKTGASSWFAMFEKALAFQVGGYDKLAEQPDNLLMFNLFTGGGSQVQMSDQNFAATKARFEKGHAVIAGSATDNALGLMGGHGYAVVGMTDKTVTLVNPYGPRAPIVGVAPEGSATNTGASKTDGEFTLTKEQFMKNFWWMASSNKSVR